MEGENVELAGTQNILIPSDVDSLCVPPLLPAVSVRGGSMPNKNDRRLWFHVIYCDRPNVIEQWRTSKRWLNWRPLLVGQKQQEINRRRSSAWHHQVWSGIRATSLPATFVHMTPRREMYDRHRKHVSYWYAFIHLFSIKSLKCFSAAFFCSANIWAQIKFSLFVSLCLHCLHSRSALISSVC